MGTWATLVPALCLLLVLAAPHSARAQIANPYEVKGVAVDVTAETASAARAQALREGQQRAMTILLERMTLKSPNTCRIFPWPRKKRLLSDIWPS